MDGYQIKTKQNRWLSNQNKTQQSENHVHIGRSVCYKLWVDMTQWMSFNSSLPSAAYMRQRIGQTLVQIMACRLFSAKPLSKPMLGYCQLDPREQT